ncbi:MAG TPA: AI-2E family transporter [Candidatus Limnocylindrales bacterium]|nr:AI-2E family transporter [Candidatus Limnocylindrales bacterium]
MIPVSKLKLSPTLVTLFFIFMGGVLFYFFSSPLRPFLAAMVVAYLLNEPVTRLELLGIPRILAITLVFILIIGFLIIVLFWLLPLFIEQLTNLLQDIPFYTREVRQYILDFQARHQEVINTTYGQQVLDRISAETEKVIANFISLVLAAITGAITNVVDQLVIMFLVFFFLKDKDLFWTWLTRHLPGNQELVLNILYDIDRQMGNFVRGKLAVIMILWGFTTVAFSLSGLNYSLFWGFLTGLSTLVPYFGPIIVSIPIFLVAFLQFGTWWGFVKIGLIYIGFQTIEGNILTPFITGKTTHIHPAIIILSILICNYLWGFWGVVFSVPLTIFIKSVLTQVIATWEVEKNSLTYR